jgi:L-threonylcarbamoyladenylate synthase
MTEIIKVDPFILDRAPIEKALGILRDGGLVIYPTRCLYGLGADATNPAAIEKVFAVKGRSLNRPISVLCQDAVCLRRIVQRVPPHGERIMKRFWPGWVTLVFEANDALPSVLTAGLGKIGVRLPANPVGAALVAGLGRPLTATSANLSGADGCFRVQDLPRVVLDRVDLVLDAGQLEGGPGSTVVDVTGPVPVILREGMVSAHGLKSLYGKVF